MSRIKNQISQRRTLIILLVFFVAFFAFDVQANTQNIRLEPARDTYINSGDPDRNYGTAADLRLGHNLFFNKKRILIKFNTDSIPHNALISSARLVMAQSNIPLGMPSSDIVIQRVKGSWSESGSGKATWNHQPEVFSSNLAATQYERVYFNSATESIDGFSWDLTEIVKKWQTGAYANEGVMISCGAFSIHDFQFGSKNNARSYLRPILDIEYSAITNVEIVPAPEPINLLGNIPIRNIDLHAPEISDTAVSEITESGVRITWKTNEEANSYVDYGTGNGYGRVAGENNNVTEHAIAVGELNPRTRYHASVRSKDQAGNEAHSADFTFTTIRGATDAPPDAAVFGEPVAENQNEQTLPETVDSVGSSAPAATILPESELIVNVPDVSPIISDTPVSDRAEEIATDLGFSRLPLAFKIITGIFAFSLIALLISALMIIEKKKS